ncbi:MAG: hypothetical protein SPE33_04930 [[Pasteurella] aerogenes]|nr:hypothetical protein [[Pasteurella] aerogenes]
MSYQLYQILILGLIGYFVYYILKKRNDISGKDFESYKNRYPELVKNGRVNCCKCGSHSIALMKVQSASFLSPEIMVHQCRTCGCKLYYSKN